MLFLTILFTWFPCLVIRDGHLRYAKVFSLSPILRHVFEASPKTCCYRLHSNSTRCHDGEQGWCSGKSARLPPMWLGFNFRTWRHMWVVFVVSSHPCSEGFFSGHSGFFLPPQKPTFKFQFNLEFEGHRFVSHTQLLSVTLVKTKSIYLFNNP